MSAYIQYEDMSIKNRKDKLTPDRLAIISRLPRARAGDSKALDDLGIYHTKERTPIEGLMDALDRMNGIRARELELMEKGQLPRDWELFQAWRYEVSIGRLEIPEALRDKYGGPETWADNGTPEAPES